MGQRRANASSVAEEGHLQIPKLARIEQWWICVVDKKPEEISVTETSIRGRTRYCVFEQPRELQCQIC